MVEWEEDAGGEGASAEVGRLEGEASSKPAGRSGKEGVGEIGQKEGDGGAVRIAIIGLLGTMLTVCGGLGGGLITNGVALYQMQRELEQVSVPADDTDRALTVDGGDVFVSRREAADLDPDAYFVDLDHGIALPRELPDWDELVELTVAEQLREDGVEPPTGPLAEQPVYRVRYGDVMEVRATRQTTVNGHSLPEDAALALDMLYGAEPWSIPYYSQMTVNVFDRAVHEALGMDDLADVVLGTLAVSSGHVNRLVAPEGADFIVVQSSITYDHVTLDGRDVALTLEDWFLFAETEDRFVMVEIGFSPQSGQSLQVWQDLQTYLDGVRIVR